MATLINLTDIAPLAVGSRAVTQRHPLYEIWQAEWGKLANVREGTGGFIDGTYLIAHPREWLDHDSATPSKPTAKLKARRALARYENIAATILEAKRAALFRETALRRVGSGGEQTTEIEQWWTDVTGDSTSMDEVMPTWWDLAATFGHVVLLFMPPATEAEVAADQDQPIVRVYPPLDVVDWITDAHGRLTAVKLVEALPAQRFEDNQSQIAPPHQTRVVTENEIVLFDEHAKPISTVEHGLGRIPVTVLYGRRRAVVPELGQSVLGDPRNYIDLYNLTSELRELLRNQTFSFINLPLGTGADAMTVEQAQTMLGQQTGTMNVLFSGLAASVLSGDAANVTAYQDDIKQLKRDIFRITGVQWESEDAGTDRREGNRF